MSLKRKGGASRRALIDEHFDIRLHRLFDDDFDAETVEYRGWKGVENGDLLQQAFEDGYDAFLTNDRGIPHQQALRDLKLRVVVLIVPSNELEDENRSCRMCAERSAKWPPARSVT